MADPQVVSRDEWLVARKRLLAHETGLTARPASWASAGGWHQCQELRGSLLCLEGTEASLLVDPHERALCADEDAPVGSLIGRRRSPVRGPGLLPDLAQLGAWRYWSKCSDVDPSGR
jgi:hypothetical protein